METLCRLSDHIHWVFRKEYSGHLRHIQNGRQLRAALRAGPICWPGGHEVVFITANARCLCFQCVESNVDDVLASIRHGIDDNWCVVRISTPAEFLDVPFCSRCAKEFEF